MPAADHIAFDDHGQPVRAVDFDFSTLDGGEAEISEQVQDSAERLANLLAWLSQPKSVEYFGHAFRLRLLALAWTMNPAAFGGKSLSALAADNGVKKQSLSKYAAQASRIFKIRNRSQIAHGRRWKKQRQPPH